MNENVQNLIPYDPIKELYKIAKTDLPYEEWEKKFIEFLNNLGKSDNT